MALGKRNVLEGSATDGFADDPSLVEQIRTKMLPRRGITAMADEILITPGEQNALYMLVSLLVDGKTRVAMEEPGNPRMRQLLRHAGAAVIYQPVDEYGMVINQPLQRAQLIYVTPSHQVPTAVTMANQRRRALLKQARARDQLIIEDDFEHENNYLGKPHPALRGMDRQQRVIYVSALPKVLAPGLRIGFIVASPALIREARKLRQMIVGRPNMIAQASAAFFLSLGHYDAFVARLNRIIGQRWDALRQALNHYLRGTEIEWPTQGGTALWVRCPEHIGVRELVAECARRGILIEPDTHFYGGTRRPRNYYRLGVTSIPENRIREGVQQLSQTLQDLAGEQLETLDPNDSGLCSGADIEQALRGANLLIKTFYGDPCTIVLHEDGRMSGRAGHADEDCDEGEWWVEGDLYCRRWRHWSYGEVSKMQVTIHGDQIRWWRPGGRLVDAAIINRDGDDLDS
jgi:GntR family transcriptional regulator/MocR family aminotransferase